LDRFDRANVGIVAGILAITRRFPNLGDLENRALEVLERDWPLTLDDWDVLQPYIHQLSVSLADVEAATSPTLSETLPNVVTTLQLARQHNLSSILPALYTTISQIPSSCDADFDDIFAIPGFDHPARYNPRFRSMDWSTLDATDIARLQRGRHWFRDGIVKATHLLSRPESSFDLFQGHSQCARAFSSILTRDEIMEYHYHFDLLGLWKSVMDRSRSMELGLCATCGERLYHYAAASRQSLWNSLSQIFEIRSNPTQGVLSSHPGPFQTQQPFRRFYWRPCTSVNSLKIRWQGSALASHDSKHVISIHQITSANFTALS
jgi:hypothetical protein